MKNILYTKNFNEDIKEDVNVILSPQYYWIKKINIPIKSLKEAKKIAFSILKLNEKEFFFDAVKIDNQFYAIAIRKDLKLKIDKKYIKSLRIAQCEFKDFECLNLNGNFLQKVEGIFFCFPGNKDGCLCIDNILDKLSLSNCTFNVFDTLNISKKEIILITTSFLMFIFIFIGKYFAYSIEYKKLQQKYDKLKKGNLITTFQLDSVISEYEKEIKLQTSLRNKIKLLQKLNLKKGEYIKTLFYKNGVLKIVIVSNRNFDYLFKGLNFKSKHNKFYEVEIYE